MSRRRALAKDNKELRELLQAQLREERRRHREIALDQAIRFWGNTTSSADDVLAVAEAFRKFLAPEANLEQRWHRYRLMLQGLS